MDDSQKYAFFLTDLFQSFDFDPSKLDVYIRHRLYEFDQDGNKTIKETRYEIKKCEASDFNITEFEGNWWKTHKSRKPYCINDPDKTLSLLGKEENEATQKSWS